MPAEPVRSDEQSAGDKPSVSRSPSADSDSAMRVLRQFRLVFNAVKTHFQQMESQSGLSGAQVWALSVIRDRPGIGVNDLARALQVRQPTASNLVKTLAAKGCIEVRPHERDRRAVALYLVPTGGKILRQAPGPHAGVLPEALAGLEAPTLVRLEADLAALIRALGADKHGANVPLGQV